MNRVISVWRLLCSYVAFYESHLEIHSRSHPGDKPFSCELCNQKFSRKSNLTRHLLTHEDIGNFSVQNVITRLWQNSTSQYIYYAILELNLTNVTYVTILQLLKASWLNINKHTVMKNHTPALFVHTKLNSQPVSIFIWRNIPVILLYVLNVTIRQL